MSPIFILIAEEANFHQRMLIMGLVWKQLVHLGNNEEMIVKQKGDYSWYLKFEKESCYKISWNLVVQLLAYTNKQLEKIAIPVNLILWLTVSLFQ